MNRFAQGVASALLLAGTALHAGCGNSASGLTTGSAEAPGALGNADPMARPVAVAWTSARAKRCGFYFDPAKLKINYLSYERTQGAGNEQLANIEKSLRHELQDHLRPHLRRCRLLQRPQGPRHQGRPAASPGRRLHPQPARAQAGRQLRLLRLRGVRLGQAIQQQGFLDGKRQESQGHADADFVASSPRPH